MNRQDTSLKTVLADLLRHHASQLDTIAIPGFGSFQGVKQEEHVTVDPESGKRILNPPCIKLKFTPSVILRKKFNK